MNERKLSEIFNPTPKQLEFLQAVKNPKYKYLLYGGAKSGGKSYILRWALVVLLIKWALRGLKGVRTGLFCEDYPSLKDRQLTKINTEFPRWLGTLSGSQTEGLVFKLHEKYGGGAIAMRNLDDPSKYASSEFAAIAVDELTKNPKEKFDQLRSIMRWPGLEDVKFLAGTNPGSIGHRWVKSLWIKQEFDPDEKEADRFYFLQALAKDNPHNADTYMLQLSSLKPELRRAYLEGDWDLFEGQFFTQWRDSIHVIKPFTIPADWHKIIGIDYGNVTIAEAIARDPEEDTYYCFDEWSSLGLSKTERAAGFAKWMIRHGYWDIRCKGDTNMFIRLKELPKEKEPAVTFREKFTEIWRAFVEEQRASSPSGQFKLPDRYLNLTPVTKKSPDKQDFRIWCNDEIDDLLNWEKDEDGLWVKEPRLYVFRGRCPVLTKTLPMLTHDENVFEDIEECDFDHGYDAMKYGVLSMRDQATGEDREKIIRKIIKLGEESVV